MIQLKPGEPMRCPSCGRVLVMANSAGEVAGRFICPRANKCQKARNKEVIEV